MKIIKYIKETSIGNFNIEIIRVEDPDRSATRLFANIEGVEMYYYYDNTKEGKEGIRVRSDDTLKILGKSFKQNVTLGFTDNIKEKIQAEIKRIKTDRKNKKEMYFENIKSGKIKIEVSFYEGSPLSGYMTEWNEEDKDDEIDRLLKKLGLAEDISGWGIKIDDEFIEKVGKSFTYLQAVEYVQPKIDAAKKKKEKKVQKETDHKEKMITKAKEIGEKVEIKRFSIDCQDPREECNTDIVIVWAMPNGEISETCNHTW